MSAPRENNIITDKFISSVKGMKYLSPGISGMGKVDFDIIELDYKIQDFETKLNKLIMMVTKVASGYAPAATFGKTAFDMQKKEFELSQKADTNPYLKQHAETTKAYEDFIKHLAGLVAIGINNLPTFDKGALTNAINSIITSLNKPEIKARLVENNITNVLDLCNKQKASAEQIIKNFDATAVVKAQVADLQTKCVTQNKQLSSIADGVASKLFQSGTAAQALKARTAAGPAVHPAPPERKPGS